MIRYVLLLNFTDQGIRNVKESTRRARAFKEMAERLKANLGELYWTRGTYDIVATMEVPDEATIQALLLSLDSLGNVRSQALRAFSAEEMEGIIARMP